MTAVAAKWYAPVQKHLEFFQGLYISCQNVGNRHCFLVGGGGGGAPDGPPKPV